MKILPVIIMISILGAVVIAQENAAVPSQVNTYELEDLDKTPIQAIWLKTGDFVFFNLLGQRHAIRMDLVYQNNAKIVLYPDVDSSPQGAYAPLAQGRYIKVDLNKDDVTDMNIRLDSMQGSEDGDEGLFVFESLVDDTVIPETQGEISGTVDNKPKPKNNSVIYLGFAIIVGALFGLLIVLKLRKR